MRSLSCIICFRHGVLAPIIVEDDLAALSIHRAGFDGALLTFAVILAPRKAA